MSFAGGAIFAGGASSAGDDVSFGDDGRYRSCIDCTRPMYGFAPSIVPNFSTSLDTQGYGRLMYLSSTATSLSVSLCQD